MKCKDCGKELEGGFGIGERPFKEYRCFDCCMNDMHNLMNDMHNAFGWKNIRLINEWIAEHCPTLEGMRYKKYAFELEGLIKQIQFFTNEGDN